MRLLVINEGRTTPTTPISMLLLEPRIKTSTSRFHYLSTTSAPQYNSRLVVRET